MLHMIDMSSNITPKFSLLHLFKSTFNCEEFESEVLHVFLSASFHFLINFNSFILDLQQFHDAENAET